MDVWSMVDGIVVVRIVVSYNIDGGHLDDTMERFPLSVLLCFPLINTK